LKRSDGKHGKAVLNEGLFDLRFIKTTDTIKKERI